MRSNAHRSVMFSALILCLFAATNANAHFLWIHSILDKGKLVLRADFGEPLQRDAKYVSVAAKSSFFAIDSKGSQKKVPFATSTAGDECGATLEDTDVHSVHGSLIYGLFSTQGPPFLLTYYAKRMVALPADWKVDLTENSNLPVEIRPKMDGDQLVLIAYCDGKPKSDIEIKGYGTGAFKQTQKSDARGETRWKDLPEGDLAFYFGRTIDAKGTHEGKAYEKQKDYATLTLVVKKAGEKAASPPAASPVAEAGTIPPLPERISSFGAATADGYVYVYGGHIGTAHEHSKANQTGAFRRASMTKGGQWETLPSSRPVQGTALASHNGKLYRVGGLECRNEAKEDEDNHSVTDVECYDPKVGSWTKMPNLPTGRSSHDAIALDGKLYVIGGWNLHGSEPTQWHDIPYVMDLTAEKPEWKALPKQPFRRRALAIAAANGKIYVIAGFMPDATVAAKVDIFDVASNQWSSGPDIPNDERNGFGISAVAVGGRIVVNGFNGKVYRLSSDGKQWESAGKASVPRFFHRLAAKDANEIILLAGASRSGHVGAVETIALP